MYSYVYCGEYFLLDKLDRCYHRRVKTSKSLDRALGLPLASRQLKQETALLPYKLATFYFDVLSVCRCNRYGWHVEHSMYQQQREALRSFLEKRSKEQIKVLSRLIFHFYNDMKRKCEWKMESAAYWVEELGHDGLLS